MNKQVTVGVGALAIPLKIWLYCVAGLLAKADSSPNLQL